MQFDLIVWDFDGVLNANIVEGRLIWADRIEHDLKISRASMDLHVFSQIKQIVQGDMDVKDVLATWIAREGYDLTAQDVLDYWLKKDALPDAEVLGWLERVPCRHVIGTNNEHNRAAYMEQQMGMSAYVEQVFASGRMGVAKPDSAFFEHIRVWADLPADRILLIDDSATNITACQKLGWAGFHFSPQTRHNLPAVLGLETS